MSDHRKHRRPPPYPFATRRKASRGLRRRAWLAKVRLWLRSA